MGELQQYRPNVNISQSGGVSAVMEKEADGGWVDSGEANAELSRLAGENRELREEIKLLKTPHYYHYNGQVFESIDDAVAYYDELTEMQLSPVHELPDITVTISADGEYEEVVSDGGNSDG